MSKINSRAFAAKIIEEVINNSKPLNSLLEQKSATYSDQRDHPFIQELCYGVMRWYWQLNGIAKLLLQKPLKEKDLDIHALLLIGIYQLLHLRTADHAAINETVEATRALKKPWAANLINGVLRQFQRQQADLLAQIANNPSAHYSHPKWLLKLIQQAWPDHWQSIADANNQRPPLTLRVNAQQQTRGHYLKTLAAQHIEAMPALGTDTGIILAKPQDVKTLPGFNEGAISVQDAAAQLAAGLLKLAPGQRVLDACAAPGGKTAHILETEPNLEELVAIDIDDTRLKRIAENLLRLKLLTDPHKIKLIAADAAETEKWWDGKLFDRILLDAPCSATGVIRRHPDIKYLRRLEDITKLPALQLKLLATLWPLLKPGGILVYATCSILPQENAEVVREFLSKHPEAVEMPLDIEDGIPANPGVQILPGNHEMDGFYYARLTRT